jgi:FMN-dependent NADH-azoreductase
MEWEFSMPTLLYVEASPRKSASASIEAGRVFLEEIRRHRSDLAIDTLDLWHADLPEFDGATIAAKYARLAGREMEPAEATAWRQITGIVDRLRAADSLLIATPMWNFGIPYKLKHWIDLVTQPGLTFSFDPETGYSPILPPRPSLVILSSAGDYATGTSRGRPDLATPYLKAALAFIGLSDVAVVPIGPTMGRTNLTDAARSGAHDILRSLAANFMTEVAA